MTRLWVKIECHILQTLAHPRSFLEACFYCSGVTCHWFSSLNQDIMILKHRKVMHIYYLHLCKQRIIYIFRTKDQHSMLWFSSVTLPFHLKKKKEMQETTEILDVAVSDWVHCRQEIVSFLELWSHQAPHSAPPQQLSWVPGWALLSHRVVLCLPRHQTKMKRKTNFLHQNLDKRVHSGFF